MNTDMLKDETLEAGAAPQGQTTATNETQAQPQIEPQAESQTEPQAQPQTEPRAESHTEPQAESHTEPQAEPRAESQTEPQAQPQTEPRAESSLSEIETLRAQLAEAHERHLRLHAEFENHRKRTAGERERLLQQGAEGLLLTLLPVFDDIERALHLIDNSAELEPEKLVAGIRLVQKNYRKALEKLGIEQLQPEGKPFDSNYHEAIANQPVEDEAQKGHVLHAVSPGYVFHGRVIRFAQVVVGE